MTSSTGLGLSNGLPCMLPRGGGGTVHGPGSTSTCRGADLGGGTTDLGSGSDLGGAVFGGGGTSLVRAAAADVCGLRAGDWYVPISGEAGVGEAALGMVGQAALGEAALGAL